jgi:hypothetical protein
MLLRLYEYYYPCHNHMYYTSVLYGLALYSKQGIGLKIVSNRTCHTTSFILITDVLICFLSFYINYYVTSCIINIQHNWVVD